MENQKKVISFTVRVKLLHKRVAFREWARKPILLGKQAYVLWPISVRKRQKEGKVLSNSQRKQLHRKGASEKNELSHQGDNYSSHCLPMSSGEPAFLIN